MHGPRSKKPRRGALQALYRGAGPRRVLIDVTDRCFFRCVTCDKWQSRPGLNEMHTTEWLDALRRVFDWVGAYHLSISGGEPLWRDDVCQIIAFARDHGLTTSMMTNGWLVDAQVARELLDAGLDNLTFSLNAFDPETHDRTRGVSGSHARVVAGIGHVQRARADAAARVTISLSTIIAGATATGLPDLVRWASQTGLDAVGVQPLMDVSLYRPYGERAQDSTARELHEPGCAEFYRSDRVALDELWSGDPQQIATAIEELIALKKRGYPVLNTVQQLRLIGAYLRDPASASTVHCHAGVDDLLIDPYGDVRLCYRMEPIGNILAEPPAALWSSDAAGRARAKISACRMGCALLNCTYRPPIAERVSALWQRLATKWIRA